MKTFIVAALCVLAVSAAPGKKAVPFSSQEPHIIDGEAAAEGQFPWQVAVNFNVGGQTYFCGGAIISENWVLTAAHCADGASSFELRFGSLDVNGGISQSTTNAVVHPDYNDWLNNDVAVIQLSEPLSFTDTIQAIPLPTAGQVVGVGETVRVSGWGKTSDNAPGVSSVLNFVDITTISNAECEAVYGPTILDNTLCCKGNPSESTCNGDSGGPLTRNSVHVGVVSFVHIEGCASGNPSGFIRTESMLDWIAQTTGVRV